MRNLARLARSLGDAVEAARLRSEADAYDAPNVTVKRALARWDFAEGRYAAAAERFEASFDLWPDRVISIYLIKCYRKLGDSAARRKAVERDVELWPVEYDGRLFFAEALLDDGEPLEALVEVDRAIALARMDANAHWMRMRILEALRRYSEAAEAVRTVIAIRSAKPQHFVKLGDLLGKVGDKANAMAILEEGIAAFPKNDVLKVVLHWLGRSAGE